MTGSELYEFGPFSVDPARCRLLRGETPVALPPKAFDLLLLLVRRRSTGTPSGLPSGLPHDSLAIAAASRTPVTHSPARSRRSSASAHGSKPHGRVAKLRNPASHP